MATTSAIGLSQLAGDSYQAGVEAASKAMENIDHPVLAVVFMTEQYNEHTATKGIRSVIGDTPLIGCTAPSLIFKNKIYADGLGVAVIQSDTLKVSVGLGENISQDASAAGRSLGSLLTTIPIPKDNPKNQVLLLFADASMTKGVVSDTLTEAFREFGSFFRFFGGGSADNLHFKKSVQIINQQIVTDSVAAALIVSDTPQGISLMHGWEPTGQALVVTKSQGKVVQELDGEPALSFYMNHLGEDIDTFDFSQFYAFASGHPIGIPMGSGEYVVRDPLFVSLEDQSITFVSEVPENSVVRIMAGSTKSLLHASVLAAKEAKAALDGKSAALTIVADCVSRLLYLGDQAETELTNISSSIGEDVPMIGFFSFGEFGIEGGGPPAVYNKTCGIYVIPQ